MLLLFDQPLFFQPVQNLLLALLEERLPFTLPPQAADSEALAGLIGRHVPGLDLVPQPRLSVFVPGPVAEDIRHVLQSAGHVPNQRDGGWPKYAGQGLAQVFSCNLEVLDCLGAGVERGVQLVEVFVFQGRQGLEDNVRGDLAFRAELLQLAHRDAHLFGNGLAHQGRLLTDGAQFIALQDAGAQGLLQLHQRRGRFR